MNFHNHFKLDIISACTNLPRELKEEKLIKTECTKDKKFHKNKKLVMKAQEFDRFKE